jgi:hypothetical protein
MQTSLHDLDACTAIAAGAVDALRMQAATVRATPACPPPTTTKHRLTKHATILKMSAEHLRGGPDTALQCNTRSYADTSRSTTSYAIEPTAQRETEQSMPGACQNLMCVPLAHNVSPTARGTALPGVTNRNKGQHGPGVADQSSDDGMLQDAGPQKTHLNPPGKRAREKENGALAQARPLTSARPARKHHCCSRAKLHREHGLAKATLMLEDAPELGNMQVPSVQYNYNDTQRDRETITWRGATTPNLYITAYPLGNCPERLSRASQCTRVTCCPGATRTSLAAQLPLARTPARDDGCKTTGSDNHYVTQNQARETHKEIGMGRNNIAGDRTATAAGLGLGLGLLHDPAVARSWSHPGSWDVAL